MITLTFKQIAELNWVPYPTVESITFSNIEHDSRLVTETTIFIARDGVSTKATQYLEEVASKKPVAIFINHNYLSEAKSRLQKYPNTILFTSKNFSHDSAVLISSIFGNPSQNMKVVAVTGTNGKTSIALLLSQFYNSIQQSAMYIGTLGCFLPSTKINFGMTTPDLIHLNQYLQKGIQENVQWAFIEASSHGIEQGRIQGLNIEIGIFTNLTQDHLDYHKTMEHYFQSKKKLFDTYIQKKSTKGFVIGTDTIYGQSLYDSLQEDSIRFEKQYGKKKLISVGFDRSNVIVLSNIQSKWEGYSCTLRYEEKEYILKTQLMGTFNLQNISYLFAATLIAGIEAQQSLNIISSLKPVPGRMEILGTKNKRILVDYAHTPDALEKALVTIQELKPSRILVVFGCGGDRDKRKRPLMGTIASRLADIVIITNDNPRTEDATAIIDDIITGLSSRSYKVILNRKEAIEWAISLLGADDILLVAGKGHEEYQIIGTEKHYFSDQDVIRGALKSYEI